MSQSPKKSGSLGVERWLVPLLIIAFCIGAYAITTTFERMPPILKRGIQPSDFPQLVAALIVALTVLMAWREPVATGERMDRPVIGSILLLGAFAALAEVDFVLALGLVAAAIAAVWGERRVAPLLIVGVATPLLVFLLFDQLFEIRFPKGVLTSLWYG